MSIMITPHPKYSDVCNSVLIQRGARWSVAKNERKKKETLKDECKLFKVLLHMSRAKFFYHDSMI